MKPKTVQLASQKISYYESEGSGWPLVLLHGNSSSGLSFQHQLNSPLGQKQRLIAIDLPGHGGSESFGDVSAYSLPAYADIVAATAEALKVPEAIFVGWSMGGHLVLEAHNRLPQARGLVIFGAPPVAFPPPMEDAFLLNPAAPLAFKTELTEAEAKTFAASFFAPEATLDLTPFVSDILRTDGNARLGISASLQKPGGYQDEVDIVANLTIPLTIFHGEREQLINGSYISQLEMPTLWRGAVQIIAGAGHAPHWEQPEQFNALLEAFIEDVVG